MRDNSALLPTPSKFQPPVPHSDAADEQVQSESQTGSIVPAGMSWPVIMHLLLLTLSSNFLASSSSKSPANACSGYPLVNS